MVIGHGPGIKVSRTQVAARSHWRGEIGRRCGSARDGTVELGALVLVIWEGLNTVVANLVLADIIQPTSGFDRPGMVGHAYQ